MLRGREGGSNFSDLHCTKLPNQVLLSRFGSNFRLGTRSFFCEGIRVTPAIQDRALMMAPTSSRTISLDDLTPQNIGVLKRLNKVLFPVPYSDKFYKESLTVGELAKYGNEPTLSFFVFFVLTVFVMVQMLMVYSIL